MELGSRLCVFFKYCVVQEKKCNERMDKIGTYINIYRLLIVYRKIFGTSSYGEDARA